MPVAGEAFPRASKQARGMHAWKRHGDVDVDVALIGCPAHAGQGYIAAVAALLNAYFRLSQAARIESLNPTATSCNSELNETCL